MTKINYAELEERLMSNPTLEECRRQGSTHYAYGWTPVPWGNWNEEQTAAYLEGYAAQKMHLSAGNAGKDVSK